MRMVCFPCHLAQVGCLAHKQAKMVRRGPEPEQQQEHLEMPLGKEVSGADGDVPRCAAGLM